MHTNIKAHLEIVRCVFLYFVLFLLDNDILGPIAGTEQDSHLCVATILGHDPASPHSPLVLT